MKVASILLVKDERRLFTLLDRFFEKESFVSREWGLFRLSSEGAVMKVTRVDCGLMKGRGRRGIPMTLLAQD